MANIINQIYSLGEFRNKFDDTKLSWDNLKTIWKDHIQEYWFSSKNDPIDLKLDIVGDETLTADCDVTDHYVESNQPYQDQITLKPKTYTISGEVGELVWYQRNAISQELGQVAQKLEGVMSFLPIRSKGFNQMKKTIMKASQWVDTASNAISKLSSLIGTVDGERRPLTNQEQAYMYLLYLRDGRSPITVKTPWGYLVDYVITNLEFKQPKETKDKSLITITFKEFRTVSIRTVPFDSEKYQGNAAFENQPETPLGKTDGEDVSIATTEEVDIPTEQGETTGSTGEFDEVCPVFDGDGNQATLIQAPNGELWIRDDTELGGRTFFPKGTSDYNKFESIGFNQCGEALKRRGFTPEK